MMRILFLGTGPFAVPSLRSLAASRHDLVGLVTRPAPTNLRRKQKPPLNPMRQAAEALELEVWDPGDVNAPEGIEILRRSQCDLLVVCDYGQILSNEALSTAPLGGINLHGSLLPKYRGAAPVHWAIYHGDSTTGISVIHMTPRLDGGPILQQHETPIGPSETMPQLESRLSELGKEAVLAAIEQLEAWDRHSPIGKKQDPSLATKAPRLRKEQGLIDWSHSAEQISNQIRAFQPWPGSYSWLHRDDHPPQRIVVGRATSKVTDGTPSRPGLLRIAEGRLFVATGCEWLEILELQPAGGRMMTADEFLRGHPSGTEACFGGPN